MEHWMEGRGPAVTQARRVLDELFSLTYEELRRLAFAVKRTPPATSLPGVLPTDVFQSR
jgi:hypothetical protein